MTWRIYLFGSNLMYNSPIKPLIHPQDQKKSPWMQNRAVCQGVVSRAWNPSIHQSETGGLIWVQVQPGLCSEASSKWKHVKVLYQPPILLSFDFLFHCISLVLTHAQLGTSQSAKHHSSYLCFLSYLFSLIVSPSVLPVAEENQHLLVNCSLIFKILFKVGFRKFSYCIHLPGKDGHLLLCSWSQGIFPLSHRSQRQLAWISSKNYFSFFFIVGEFYTHMWMYW